MEGQDWVTELGARYARLSVLLDVAMETVRALGESTMWETLRTMRGDVNERLEELAMELVRQEKDV